MIKDSLLELENKIHQMVIRMDNLAQENRDLMDTVAQQRIKISQQQEEIKSLREKIDISANNIGQTIEFLESWLETKKGDKNK